MHKGLRGRVVADLLNFSYMLYEDACPAWWLVDAASWWCFVVWVSPSQNVNIHRKVNATTIQLSELQTLPDIQSWRHLISHWNFLLKLVSPWFSWRENGEEESDHIFLSPFLLINYKVLPSSLPLGLLWNLGNFKDIWAVMALSMWNAITI